jgi:hypothetical protein
MEYFEIKNKGLIKLRRVIAVSVIVIAIVWFFNFLDDGKIFHLLGSIFFVFYGVSVLTGGFGTEKCWFRTGENFLIIKWMNMFKPVHIHDSGIQKISMERMRIVIYRNGRKPLKLNIDFMERDKKTEVYKFLIEYAKKRNITLEKHSNTLFSI